MRVRLVAVLSALVLSAASAEAQSLSHYRDYALASTVASVMTISGSRATDVKTTRERPAVLRELEWRTPYTSASAGQIADPVHDVVFSFYNDQLYRVVVNYARDRVAGLTAADFVAALSKTYGPAASPTVPRGGQSGTASTEPGVVARWEDTAARLTLTRGAYSGEFQVVLISKAINDNATAAVKAGLLLDSREAPQRAIDQQKQDAAADLKVREANKAGFRP